MNRNVLLILLAILFSNYIFGQVISDFIQVDQFGYLPDDTKVAVLTNPQIGYNAGDSYTPSATIELRDASTDAMVFSAAAVSWNGGATHAQSGDKGWWFDFGSITTPGEYYVYDVANDERSAVFKIEETVYDDVLKAATKMFYYNRCNMSKSAPYAESNWTDGNNFENALQDANCRFVDDPTNSALEKDLTGGWFDAGDYNKYTTFANSTVHMLLSAYEENPEVFSDDWDIPESGNGYSDLLDELKWELDWLLKMCNDDGSTIIKMGSIDYAENGAAPPSVNTDQRYYGPTCTSASLVAAGMFAHAAKVYTGITGLESFVTELETEAIAAWDYVLPLINAGQYDLDCDTGIIKSGDADRTEEEQKRDALIAAIYLFDHFGDSDYNDYVVNHIDDAPELDGDYWGGVIMEMHDALLNYTTIPGADVTVKNSIINSITTGSTNNWNDFYGFSDDDLYRSFMPDWNYHWGSNLPKAGYGLLNLLLNTYDINPGSESDYSMKASEQIHYFHGVNPQGLVYLSNMYGVGGDKGVNEIYHTWFADGTDWDNTDTSLYGPAPGYVVGGANQNYNANTSLIPPYNQPPQKSYLDFNTGWPDNSWVISEPAIYTQAFYVRLMANYASEGTPLAIKAHEQLWGHSELDKNQLFWTLDTESDIEYSVNRSFDGVQWEEIAKLNNTKNKTTSKMSFTDKTPQLGLNYYRITIELTNNSTKESNIITIINNSHGRFVLTPNPSSNFVLIDGLDALRCQECHLEFLDVRGVVVLESQIGGNDQIDVTSLNSGIYMVTLYNEDKGLSVVKFVKE